MFQLKSDTDYDTELYTNFTEIVEKEQVIELNAWLTRLTKYMLTQGTYKSLIYELFIVLRNNGGIYEVFFLLTHNQFVHIFEFL